MALHIIEMGCSPFCTRSASFHTTVKGSYSSRHGKRPSASLAGRGPIISASVRRKPARVEAFVSSRRTSATGVGGSDGAVAGSAVRCVCCCCWRERNWSCRRCAIRSICRRGSLVGEELASASRVCSSSFASAVLDSAIPKKAKALSISRFLDRWKFGVGVCRTAAPTAGSVSSARLCCVSHRHPRHLPHRALACVSQSLLRRSGAVTPQTKYRV